MPSTPNPARRCLRPLVLLAFCGGLAALRPLPAADSTAPLELRSGDRVVLIGDGLLEEEQRHGWLELMLTTRFSDRDVTFRNLGWSGDTPAGASRLGLSLLQAGKEPPQEGWTQLTRQLDETQPTVALIGYGMASSFAGPAGLAPFKADYLRLLDALARRTPAVRVVLLGPIRHEALGAPWPDPAAHNAELARYSRAIAEIAAERKLPFVPLFDRLNPPAGAAGQRPLTRNGIQLDAAGYRTLAETLELAWFGSAGAWRDHPRSEPLRQAILRKNEWYYHRSRPANLTYIFGFRKNEQGQNAAEIPRFDTLVAAEERRIALLRTLPPADAPAPPRRRGSLTAARSALTKPNFDVADGFEVTLWAENPQLRKPIHLNFDARGRLWVATSEVYPQLEPGQAPTDEIVVLEDTTGRGRADRATVFADGLLIPTGLEPGDGGVYVAQGTELLHLRDTDGDGRADVRRTVLNGFGTEDTHCNVHSLRWGPDGRLYLNQSVFTRTHVETPHGVVRHLAGGIFRLDPRDERFEVVFRGWTNPWGHQFDAFGQSFVTDGANFQGISWGIPGANYRTSPPAPHEMPSISPGVYPKFCGLEIIRSRHFPDDWQGDLVTCDFRAHRVVRFSIADQGAGYVTRERPDLIRSTTDSFRPVDVKLGPDGALYIADWSNPIIQHGEVDFRDPRRDREHGRIWRIAAKNRPLSPRIDLTRRSIPELLNGLVAPDDFTQRQSRRVLIERGATAVLPALETWRQSRPNDEPALLQALWLYQAFNHPQPALLDTLTRAADPRIRAATVRALPAGPALPALTRLVVDAHPRVRLEAVRALGRQGTATAADLALTVLDRPMDPYLEGALGLTLRELAQPWLAALKAGPGPATGRDQHLAFGLKAVDPALAGEVINGIVGDRGVPTDGSGPWIELIATAGGTKELGVLFDQLTRGTLSSDAALRAGQALADAARLRRLQPERDLATLGPLLRSDRAPLRLRAVQLAGAWRVAALGAPLVRIAGETTTPDGERRAAFSALREIGGAAVLDELRSLAAPARPPAIRRDAVVALASLNLSAALPDIIAVLSATSEADATTLWRSLLGIRGAGTALAEALPAAKLPPAVARAGLRPAREGSQNAALVPVLLRLAGLSLDTAALSAAEYQRLAATALERGDPGRGERIYRRPELACVACHAIGGAGGTIGPDLTSIGASAPPDYLLESLLNPAAKIKEGYHAVLVATKDQLALSGMVVREDGRQLTLRDAAGLEVSVATANIAARTSVGSLMPAGLIDGLLPEERDDLVAFLARLGKPGDFDAARGGVARLWKLYLVGAANQHLGVERVIAGDPSLPGWAPAFTLVNGILPREACEAAFPLRSNTRGFYAATRFTAARAGPAHFTLTGATQGLWVNGRRVRPGATFTAEVRTGENTLVVQLDAAAPPAALRLAGETVEFSAAW